VPAARSAFATTKVDGTDNVYVFRYAHSRCRRHPRGVIPPIPSARAPQAVVTYVEEIKKVPTARSSTDYSLTLRPHRGGKPFKDAGAKSSHTRRRRNASPSSRIRPAAPRRYVRQKRTITLGGTALELTYVG